MQYESIVRLEDLPADVIIAIFHFLDEKSLCRIAQVCRYFSQLASSNEIWDKWKQKRIIVSNEYGLKTCPQPTFKEQCKLSNKWRLGRCKVRNILKFRKNYLPWMAFDPDMAYLYLSVGDAIERYSTKGLSAEGHHYCSTNSVPKHHFKSKVHEGLDVTRFCVDENYIVTGGWHGNLSVATTDGLNFITHERAHASDVSDVAQMGNVIISGSRDQTVKIWKLDEENMRNVELRSSEVIHDTVLSLSVNRAQGVVAVGTGGLGGVHPLQVKDLERGTHLYSLGDSYKNGAGVLDCHFQTPFLLMSTGYDTYIRLWDSRISHCSCVRSWEEPHDNTVYCVSSDHHFGFVSGSCRHGVTRLWDTRMENCIQLEDYFHWISDDEAKNLPLILVYWLAEELVFVHPFQT